MQIELRGMLTSAVTVADRYCDDDVGERRVPPKTVRRYELAEGPTVQLFHRPGAQPSSRLPAAHLLIPKDRFVTDAFRSWHKEARKG